MHSGVVCHSPYAGNMWSASLTGAGFVLQWLQQHCSDLVSLAMDGASSDDAGPDEESSGSDAEGSLNEGVVSDTGFSKGQGSNAGSSPGEISAGDNIEGECHAGDVSDGESVPGEHSRCQRTSSQKSEGESAASATRGEQVRCFGPQHLWARCRYQQRKKERLCLLV